MTGLLIFSFLAGLITILAPCIWPLLPIVFSASYGGGRRKSLGITLGIMTSFTICTLFISYLIKIFPFNPNQLRLVATVIIALLGLSLMIPSIGARMEDIINHLLGPLQSRIKKRDSGLGAGLLTGISLGLLWAPCAGPILAAVAALSATQSVNLKVMAVTLAYVLGLGIPLYFLSTLSARLFNKMRAVNRYTGRIQQAFGLVMIAAAFFIYSNYDKTIQLKVLDLFPGYSRFLGQLENNSRLQKELDNLTGRKAQSASEPNENLLIDAGAAPDFAGIAQWLNVPAPLALQDLRGRVVLVDFWTYSCINCLRTLPHLTAWYEHYKNEGLVIIGVHTPEFAFEKETRNVENAVKQFHITYPVAQDNDYQTWYSYQNRYWPAEYLIDAQGQIRRVHYGEGRYHEMEEAIRALLKENGRTLGGLLGSVQDQTPRYDRTPETYLGSKRMQRFDSPQEVLPGARIYTLPPDVRLNHFAFQGTWEVHGQYAQSGPAAALVLKFKADKVFLVAGPLHAGDKIKVFMDKKPVGDIALDVQRLYDVVDLKGDLAVHTLRLEFPVQGTAVYVFTFG